MSAVVYGSKYGPVYRPPPTKRLATRWDVPPSIDSSSSRGMAFTAIWMAPSWPIAEQHAFPITPEETQSQLQSSPHSPRRLDILYGLDMYRKDQMEFEHYDDKKMSFRMHPVGKAHALHHMQYKGYIFRLGCLALTVETFTRPKESSARSQGGRNVEKFAYHKGV